MRSFPDIVYVERKEGLLALDLFLPTSMAPTALIVFVHGGGFAKGSRKSEFATSLAERLATHGLATAAVGYRLNAGASLPRSQKQAVRANRSRAFEAGVNLRPRLIGPRFEAARQDIGTALTFLRTSSVPEELIGLNIGMIGVSAGGIAGLALVHSPDNLPRYDGPICLITLGAALVHPWAIRKTAAPCLMLHSAQDRVISPKNNDILRPFIAKSGAPISQHTCSRRGHNAPMAALMQDDAPDGTPYWNSALDLFEMTGLLNQGPASV
ncbi:hypothetical protein NBRC116594_03480 [Shimia sp. NS0008-38b]|uniref:hypothetical protein n=1 Tax=Shimia sp. NS0008-38b TaxID=3127653 RepID=UPI003101D4AD